MPVIEIKERWRGTVLYAIDAPDLKTAIERAVKDRASLVGASLDGASLDGASLDGASLDGASLVGASLGDDTVLDTGETWKQYREEVVPALLTAGGKSLQEIVASGCWQCHSWTNCPMATAFNVHSEGECPILLRPRVAQFVRLFDAKLIPCPVVPELQPAV